MNDVIVRPLERSDHAAWRTLWTAYLTFYEATVPEAVYETTWERLFTDGEFEPRGFIALADGEPVGLVHYLFHRSCWTIDSICYLQDLFADPDVRGSGIGRALIEGVYAKAAEAGAPEVYWMTQEFNATARQLYDRIAGKTPFIVYQKNL